ncbi:hypothetical protein B0H13DRAFT_1898218 [Mycena leptocephala]|nr:hypothetical protein B0H13DRAFT_1898218 [Mycena leptocephala]
MPRKPTATQTRLTNSTTCLTMTADTLEMLARNLKIPLLEPIFITTQSLLKLIESDTGGELPPIVLKHILKFTETLHKIHTFVEAQQIGSKIKRFFHQGEIDTINLMADIAEIQENAQKRHQEVLTMVEALSEATSSDRASSISRVYSGSHNSSNSISMLPSEPKIFHGRESELSDILKLFSQGTPRIAILGAGGMGKTSVARAVVHHADITTKYEQRLFVACDSAASKVELAALIGAHLGLKAGPDLTCPVVQHFSSSPPSLLILDNLETLWEPTESRHDIEEFLSLLTDVNHLALMITMRGAERPAKVAWTRPFLLPLKPLEQAAALRTFIDIADNGHSPEEVDKVLSLTDNMPLAINLLAQLVDSEGCSNVLSRWEVEKTSMISEGYDKRSNLDLSISLSLSSPRIESQPHSRELLSLLSMLPDGLSDVELVQSNLPIDDIGQCKAALIRTSLAYSNQQKRLKALVPIREYVHKIQPPGDHLVRPLLKHFQELLEFYVDIHGTQSGSSIVARISSNFANIQNVLQNGLQQGHPGLRDSIYCICNLNVFSQRIGHGTIPLIGQVHNMLPQLHDHQLEAYFITELFDSRQYYPISDSETLVAQCLGHFGQVDDTDLKLCWGSYEFSRLLYAPQKRPVDCNKILSECYIFGNFNWNTKRQCYGLFTIAWFNWLLGNYSAAQLYAHESQRLARISADFYREALALAIQGKCLYTLGDYNQSISLFNRARDLLGLCGTSGGLWDRNIMNDQAEVHKLKSNYVEAYNIHNEILRAVVDQDPYQHAFTLLNIAEIGVHTGAPKQNVERNIQTARELFSTRQLDFEVMVCESTLADLYLREGNIQEAESLLKLGIKSSIPQIISYCLECLGDNDEATAISLYTVALEGFTWMDVHRSRAECLLRLGDISRDHGDLLKALELWEAARPLFEQSSQGKQIEIIDERLASVGEGVLEQHKKVLACLAELNAPSGAVEELEG